MAVEVVVPDDIIEQILLRSDVKALIRFKKVCKSWQSLISGDRFIKAHLNHSYNNDRNNNKIGHRRICFTLDNLGHRHNVKPFYFTHERNLLGSSNGLVCISPSHGQLIVANPLTREMKTVPNPKKFDRSDWSQCWGFGYDSSTDDYKVIAGFKSGSCSMSFQVFTLKTNVWKDFGTIKYMYFNLDAVGILCNGKLHWLMEDQNKKVVIISFDLFEEKFEEISGPGEFKYGLFCNLGIIEECLCLCDIHKRIWVLKNYNIRESWVSLQDALQNDKDVVHYLKPFKDSLSQTSFFTNDDLIMSRTWDVNFVPVFVRSLVSPNVHGILKIKR